MFGRIYNAVFRRLWHLYNKNKFRVLGERSYVHNPLFIMGKGNISLHRDVFVGFNTWLAAVPHTGSEICELIIGSGSRLGNFNHIYATKSIQIGENVLTADKVYISDNIHDYQDVTVPVVLQKIKQIDLVRIGDGAWIGENACIIGACVGKNSVIGANSVVTKNIPDYCVAVGAPAKIIKRYDFDQQVWRKTDKVGNFVN